MLDGDARFRGRQRARCAALVREVALPVHRGACWPGAAIHAGAVAAMRPVLGGDVPVSAAATRSRTCWSSCSWTRRWPRGWTADAVLLLERVAGRHKLPPARRRGYAEAARELGFAA